MALYSLIARAIRLGHASRKLVATSQAPLPLRRWLRQSLRVLQASNDVEGIGCPSSASTAAEAQMVGGASLGCRYALRT
jgi:hypothetical protein